MKAKNNFNFIQLLVSTNIIIALITTGFIGFLVFEGVMDYGGVEANILYVGNHSTYKTLQPAIDAAGEGDVIYAEPGHYPGGIEINVQGLTIIGNDTATTAIDGEGSGDVVTVTEDWVNISGFKIINSGTVVDPDYDSGIKLDNVKNVRIENNICRNNTYGIMLDNSVGNTIKNNTCYLNNNDGIVLFYSNLNMIENNTCHSNSNYGIDIQRSDSNDFMNNTCDFNTLSGILIYYSNSNTLVNNPCNNNYQFGILVLLSNSNTIKNTTFGPNYLDIIHAEFSDSNTYANNTCNPNNGWAISIYKCISNIIWNNKMSLSGLSIDGNAPEHWNSHTINILNTVDNNPVYYWKFRSGGTIPAGAGQIILANCSNVHIEHQILSYTPAAITITYSNSNIIDNNTMSNNYFGIIAYNSNMNSLTNNSCESNFLDGLRLVYCSDNDISLNNFKSNELHGMDFFHSDNNTMSYNTISGNSNHGIYFFESRGNSISNNIILSNENKGIFLNQSNSNIINRNNISINNEHGIYLLDSLNNDIYCNNLIDNIVQASEIDGSNNWDNGNGEGNYWSDYDGLDNGAGGRIVGDGIGDTDIAHLGLDNYPFMNNSGWLYPGIPILNDPGGYDIDGSYVITWDANRGTINYLLEEDDNSIFASPALVYEGPELSYQTSMKPNGTYYYRLKAESELYESKWSNTVDMIVDWIPAVPQNFSVLAYPEGNALNISWDPNTIDTIEYELHSNITGTWKLLETILYPAHTYNHTDLTDGQRYYYKIRSKDMREQPSNFSEILSAVPIDSIIPAAPEGLSISSVSYDSITLVWNENYEDDVEGYNIYRGKSMHPSDWGDLIGTVDAGNEEYIDYNVTELTTYYYVITAFDEVPLHESGYSNLVYGTTILGPHGPEINVSMTELEIDEDEYDDKQINLYRLFKDVNNDPLTFQCKGQQHIDITIYQENGTVVLRPEKNWFGKETLTFSASDGQYNISADIIITVKSVNDPPGSARIVKPLDGIEVDYNQPLDFAAICDDDDLAYGDKLTFKWISSISGEIGTGKNLTDIILPAGTHTITLEVIDSEGKVSTAVVNVTVLKSKVAAEDIMGTATLGAVVIIIVILIVIVIIFLMIRKKKETEKKEAEEKAEEAKIYDDTVIIPPGEDQELPAVTSPPQIEVITQADMSGAAGTSLPGGAPSAAPAQAEPSVMGAAQPYPELPPTSMPASAISIPYTNFFENVQWGQAYIIITKESNFGLDIFENLLEKHVGWGLSITRTHPSKLKQSFFMDGVTKVWLSKTSEENSVSPTNITRIAHVINKYLKANTKCIVLLDGLEYLISNNDFPKILKFIESVHENIVLNNGILLVTINPSALILKNYELLEKELANTIRDPDYAPESVPE